VLKESSNQDRAHTYLCVATGDRELQLSNGFWRPPMPCSSVEGQPREKRCRHDHCDKGTIRWRVHTRERWKINIVVWAPMHAMGTTATAIVSEPSRSAWSSMACSWHGSRSGAEHHHVQLLGPNLLDWEYS
jgi:hypothetical protein